MKTLYSVGLDVGTSTTQMILSRLLIENQASGFTVPQMEIRERQIVYRSPVHFTPLKGTHLVDGQALQALISEEYEKAGIDRQQVDTGAIIITGETSRKENAAAVLQSLSSFAGEFVVATAGPDLESILAAKGAGAADYSQKTGKTVLHMDIGGGTSNLALIEDGRITKTGCLNVGGRLVKLTGEGIVTDISPVAEGLCSFSVGDKPSAAQLEKLAQLLCQALEMAAGKIAQTPLLERLSTEEAEYPWTPPSEAVVVSFSGGVADCIETHHPMLEFGDIGPLLGRAIAQSSLCRGEYRLGEQTIRATVIGAGCHTTQLSGSTVFCRNMDLPKKNLPVVYLTRQEQDSQDFAALAGQKIAQADSPEVVLSLPGYENPDYPKISLLAQKIVTAMEDRPIYVCTQGDMAKALGQKISLLLPDNSGCLCLDRLHFPPQSFLDIGLPVGPCFPVVIKTLVLSKES